MPPNAHAHTVHHHRATVWQGLPVPPGADDPRRQRSRMHVDVVSAEDELAPRAGCAVPSLGAEVDHAAAVAATPITAADARELGGEPIQAAILR